MTDRDRPDALVAAEFARYRQAVPEVFPVPPPDAVLAAAAGTATAPPGVRSPPRRPR